MRLWILSVLIALDRVANAVTVGSCDETLSSRAHRMREKHQPVWGWTADAIDRGARLLGQTDHCRKAWIYESTRWNPKTAMDTAGRALDPDMKEA